MQLQGFIQGRHREACQLGVGFTQRARDRFHTMPVGIGLDNRDDPGSGAAGTNLSQIFLECLQVNCCPGAVLTFAHSLFLQKKSLESVCVAVVIARLRMILEAGVLADETQTHGTDGAVALLADDDFRDAFIR